MKSAKVWKTWTCLRALLSSVRKRQNTSFTKADLQAVSNFLASICGYVTSAWQSIFCFQFLNAGFSLVAAVGRCVPVFVSVIFWGFIPYISISCLHLWVSQGAIKHFEVKGVLSVFIQYYHNISFFCSQQLTLNRGNETVLNIRKPNPVLKRLVRNPMRAEILKLTEITVGDLHHSLPKNHFQIRNRTFQ